MGEQPAYAALNVASLSVRTRFSNERRSHEAISLIRLDSAAAFLSQVYFPGFSIFWRQ